MRPMIQSTSIETTNASQINDDNRAKDRQKEFHKRHQQEIYVRGRMGGVFVYRDE